MLFEAIPHTYLVPFDGSFSYKTYPTRPKEEIDKSVLKNNLKRSVKNLDELQRQLYAHDRFSVLLVFQGMDAAGKDSTIRAVMKGINPAGCQVFSFKKPSHKELDHDFLWRTNRCLPERGRIGVFNRSYYEEVLIVKVHPEYISHQKLPMKKVDDDFWQNRYASIRQSEEHLARNGTVILKFWLNVSKEEQKRRFLVRLNDPEKHWKFSEQDLNERQYWTDYMQAFEQALSETSKPWAPWYAIPADSKDYMRATIANIIEENLLTLHLHYPEIDKANKARFAKMHDMLINEESINR